MNWKITITALVLVVLAACNLSEESAVWGEVGADPKADGGRISDNPDTVVPGGVGSQAEDAGVVADGSGGGGDDQDGAISIAGADAARGVGSKDAESKDADPNADVAKADVGSEVSKSDAGSNADINPGAESKDTDGDGIPDVVEAYLGTDPFKADTDGDGLSDGDEVKVYGTNPLKADTDGDGLTDGQELGKQKDADPKTTTDPLKADTDGDGVDDGDEDTNKNGKVDAGESDPNKADTDGDGLTDGQEVLYGTDATKADTDGDGLKDGLELGLVGDADPSSQTDPLNPDTDGDGMMDGAEDANKNGKVDAGEADPNNKSDKGLPPSTDPCKGKNCDDGNVCTADGCEAGKCVYKTVAEGQSCGGGKTCAKGACEAVPGGMGCPGFQVVPAGTLPCAHPKFYKVCATEYPTTQISKFWVDKRAVLLGEYLQCVKAGACAPAGTKFTMPYLGKCKMLTIDTCPQGCTCANPEKEPFVPANLAETANYCSWRSGRVMTPADFSWASAGKWLIGSGVNNTAGYLSHVGVNAEPYPEYPSKIFSAYRQMGLLSLTSPSYWDENGQGAQGAPMSFVSVPLGGKGHALLPILTPGSPLYGDWIGGIKLVMDGYHYLNHDLGIYCAYDEQPTCK